MTRAPRTPLEILTANCRPQPAIPAILVLLLCGLFAGSAVQAGSGSFAAWGLTVGLLASCGLAIAAGFCSVFPTLAWIVLAGLLFRSSVAALALHSRVALGIGMLAAAVMTLVQVWRVKTGRFVPTISDPPSGTVD
jgi:hypothetical protein